MPGLVVPRLEAEGDGARETGGVRRRARRGTTRRRRLGSAGAGSGSGCGRGLRRSARDRRRAPSPRARRSSVAPSPATRPSSRPPARFSSVFGLTGSGGAYAARGDAHARGLLDPARRRRGELARERLAAPPPAPGPAGSCVQPAAPARPAAASRALPRELLHERDERADHVGWRPPAPPAGSPPSAGRDHRRVARRCSASTRSASSSASKRADGDLRREAGEKRLLPQSSFA